MASRTRPVSEFFALILAPASTFLFGSTILPRMDPRKLCASASEQKKNNSNITTVWLRQVRAVSFTYFMRRPSQDNLDVLLDIPHSCIFQPLPREETIPADG